MSLFVTGTDTGVGKTYVSRLIIEALRSQGVDAVGYKPIVCGERDDAEILAAASGDLAIDELNPIHLNTPVAPHVACMLENRSIQVSELTGPFHALKNKHEAVIVEGAGGWEVPITQDYQMSDLAKDLDIPVLIVAANQLGALNHIQLTVNAIKAKGLTCVGIVLNQLEDELDTAMITNKGVIEELTGLPLLDHLIHGQDFIDDQVLEAIKPYS